MAEATPVTCAANFCYAKALPGFTRVHMRMSWYLGLALYARRVTYEPGRSLYVNPRRTLRLGCGSSCVAGHGQSLAGPLQRRRWAQYRKHLHYLQRLLGMPTCAATQQ